MTARTKQFILPLLATTAILAFALHVFSDNKADVDLWGNAGFVKAPAWSQSFHRTNTFSFTDRDHPWTNHEWLAQWMFHLIHSTVGNAGLLALKVALGLLVLLLCHLSLRRDSISPPVRFLFLMLVISTIGYGFSTRPHHFTYLAIASLLFVLRHHPSSTVTWFILVPAGMVLWANLHGAFFLGLVVMTLWLFAILIHAVVRRDFSSSPAIRTLALALPIAIAVTFINPYGAGLWTFIARSFSRPRPYLSEWAPFDPISHTPDHVDFIFLAAITCAAVLLRAKSQPLALTVLWAAGLLSAVMLRRQIPLFAIISVFTAAPAVESIAGKHIEDITQRIPKVVLAGSLGLFTAISLFFAATFNKTSPLKIEVQADKFPVGVVSFMSDAGIRGNLLPFFDWAEYCMWKLPDCPVFMDGRFQDAYRDRTIDSYLAVVYCWPGWQSVLATNKVDILLLHNGNPASEAIRYVPEWRAAASNNIATLFLKLPEHADFFASRTNAPVFCPSPAPSFFP